MTPAALRRRIQFWQRKLEPLGLRHWRFEVRVVEAPQGCEGSSAAVCPSNQYDSAWFEFSREFITTADQRDLDEVIVHELMHVLMRDYDTAIEQAEEWMPEGVCTAYNARLKHEQERVVDRLARALVRIASE